VPRDTSHAGALSHRGSRGAPPHASRATHIRTETPHKRNDSPPLRPWQDPAPFCVWPNWKAKAGWEHKMAAEKAKAKAQKKRDGRKYHPVKDEE